MQHAFLHRRLPPSLWISFMHAPPSPRSRSGKRQNDHAPTAWLAKAATSSAADGRCRGSGARHLHARRAHRPVLFPLQRHSTCVGPTRPHRSHSGSHGDERLDLCGGPALVRVAWEERVALEGALGRVQEGLPARVHLPAGQQRQAQAWWVEGGRPSPHRGLPCALACAAHQATTPKLKMSEAGDVRCSLATCAGAHESIADCIEGSRRCASRTLRVTQHCAPLVPRRRVCRR